MTRKTLVQLEAVFREQAEAHQSVNSYYYGVEDIVNRDKDLKPLVVRFAPDSVTYNSKETIWTLILEVWGETLEDDTDRVVIESEAESTMNDLLASTANGLIGEGGFNLPRDEDGNIFGGIVSVSLVHEKEARLTGWQVSLDISAPNDYNYCEFPNNS